MTHLIDKDALVAEIERLRKIQPTDEFQPKEQNKIDWLAGKEFAIITLQMFLDTLEVKEVDLEKEFENYMDKYNGVWVDSDYIRFAEHFFALGVSVSNKAQKGEEV